MEPARRDLARMLQWAFAAFAALNVGLLLNGSDATVFRLMAIVGYGAGAVLSVVAALRWHAFGRRLAIGLHLALAPLQFVFSIAESIALVGIPLSLTILARCKPRFPLMSPRTRRVWLTLHVGFSVGWLGVALTMTALAVTGWAADSHAVRRGAYEVLHVVDLAVAIPSMALSIVTGLVVSLGTKWGLVRYRWVLTKFAISVSIPLVAGTVENALADELALRTVDPAGRPGATGIALAACLGSFTVALWTATVLSVVKPWGRTRWGQRVSSSRAAPAPAAPGRPGRMRNRSAGITPGQETPAN
ncbi:hypothetical protein GCM10010399_25390 [Dactylosporangium fulvum]|uniref:Integral membrane protein n=1 Tax=Dactylosporangium fulvum TaxID=53359 RepID=A0ABY5WCK8_9ACTN|nr:hypothetical protein [Dactylosporangium fulvum]UWP86974.1 hypothetical protein Dfulv_23135 [Dactylosporangium fulvum]